MLSSKISVLFRAMRRAHALWPNSDIAAGQFQRPKLAVCGLSSGTFAVKADVRLVEA
jgi:hypothetical protein